MTCMGCTPTCWEKKYEKKGCTYNTKPLIRGRHRRYYYVVRHLCSACVCVCACVCAGQQVKTVVRDVIVPMYVCARVCVQYTCIVMCVASIVCTF